MPTPADYRELSLAALDPRRIEALWTFAASSPGRHVVLPDGRMDLVASYRVDAHGGVTAVDLLIAGPSCVVHHVPVARGNRFLGLRFRVGWGGACLGLDPSRLRDAELRGAAVDQVLGPHAARLRSSPTAVRLRQALVETGHVLASATRTPARFEIEKALDLVHLMGGRLAIRNLAWIVGAPERSLRRRIEASVGLSIKTLASVLRFQRTMRLLSGVNGPALTLAQAAHEGGYADQAHMTREFRRRGGFTPGRRPSVSFGSLPIAGLAETFNTEAASRL